MEPETFLSLLTKSGSAIRPALTTFSSLGKRSNTYDSFRKLASAYLEKEPGCTTIFKLWESERNKNQSKDVAIILDSLSAVLRYTKQESLEEQGMVIVRGILSHQKSLHQAINIQRTPINKSVLRLMTNMIRLSETAIRTFYRSFDISGGGLPLLGRKRSPVDKWSVRSLFISFITSLFHAESAEIVEWVLKQKTIVQTLFKELEKDPKHTILTLLASLRIIALRQDVSRKEKLAIFTPHHLSVIGRLYFFSENSLVQGRYASSIKTSRESEPVNNDLSAPSDINLENQLTDAKRSSKNVSHNSSATVKVEPIYKKHIPSKSSTEDKRVPDVVHELLILVCSNTAVGLCFVPQASHVSTIDWRQPWRFESCANSTIQQFLISLKGAALIKDISALVMTACRACPDILPHLLTQSFLPFDHKLTLTNIANLRLVFKILRFPMPPMNHQMYSCLEFRSSMIVPECVMRGSLTKLLQSPFGLITHMGLSLLVACLQRLDAEIKGVTAAGELLSEQDREAYVQSLRTSVRKRLPDVQSVITLSSLGQQYNALENVQQTSKTHHKQSSKRQSPLADSSVALVYRALVLYQRFFPDVLSTVDLGRLLPSPEIAVSMSSSTLQELMCVLIEAGPSIDWLKPVGAVANKPHTDSKIDNETASIIHTETPLLNDSNLCPSKKPKLNTKLEDYGSTITRLHWLLQIHALLAGDRTGITIPLLRSILKATGAFSESGQEELEAWVGLLPLHSAIINLITFTYENTICQPLSAAEDILGIASALHRNPPKPRCDNSNLNPKSHLITEPNTPYFGAPIDVSAFLFSFVQNVCAWCDAQPNSPASKIVVIYAGDLLLRITGIRSSALLMHIIMYFFLEPLRKHRSLIPALDIIETAIIAVVENKFIHSASFIADTLSVFGKQANSHKDIGPTMQSQPNYTENQFQTLSTPSYDMHDATFICEMAMIDVFTLSFSPEEEDKTAKDLRELKRRENFGFLRSGVELCSGLIILGCSTQEWSTKCLYELIELFPRHILALLSFVLPTAEENTWGCPVTLPALQTGLELNWMFRGMLTSAISYRDAMSDIQKKAWVLHRLGDANDSVRLFMVEMMGIADRAISTFPSVDALQDIFSRNSVPEAIAYSLACPFGNLLQLVNAASEVSTLCQKKLDDVLKSTLHLALEAFHRPLCVSTNITALTLGDGLPVPVISTDIHVLVVFQAIGSQNAFQVFFDGWIKSLRKGINLSDGSSKLVIALARSARQKKLHLVSNAFISNLSDICQNAHEDCVEEILEIINILAPDKFDAIVSKIPPQTLYKLLCNITLSRAHILRRAVSISQAGASHILLTTTHKKHLLEDSSKRAIVAECILKAMQIPDFSPDIMEALTTSCFDRLSPAVWTWTGVLKHASNDLEIDSELVNIGPLFVHHVLDALAQGSSMSWLEILASICLMNKFDLALQSPAPVPSLLDHRVFHAAINAVSKHHHIHSTAGEIVSVLVALNGLLQLAIQSLHCIDRSLELVSQSFLCPVGAVVACDTAIFLITSKLSDSPDLTVTYNRSEALLFLETANDFLTTVMTRFFFDLEPAVAKACRLIYGLAGEVELASRHNVILDARRMANMIVQSQSIAQVLNFSEMSTFRQMTQYSMTKDRMRTSKQEILLLIKRIVFQYPQLMAGDLGHSVLDAYEGSLVAADIICLQLLLFAESQGMKLSRMLLLTGTGTSPTRKAYLARGAIHNSDPMAAEGLARIDARRVKYTARQMHHMPDVGTLRVALSERSSRFDVIDDSVQHLQAEQEQCKTEGNMNSTDSSMVYDLTYLLPLLKTVLVYGGISCVHDFIEKDCARICFVAMSSSSRRIRLLASATLATLADVIESARAKEFRQLKTTVLLFRNSLTEADQQLPCILSTFGAECCHLSLHPSDLPMFSIAMKFVSSRPTLDMKDLPLFLTLFNSASMTHRKERMWYDILAYIDFWAVWRYALLQKQQTAKFKNIYRVLNLLSSGTRNKLDLELVKRRQAVELSMAFYLSPLSDHASRLAILGFLNSVACVEDGGAVFLLQRGILPWLDLAVHLINTSDYVPYFEFMVLTKIIEQGVLQLFFLLLSPSEDPGLYASIHGFLSKACTTLSHDTRLLTIPQDSNRFLLLHNMFGRLRKCLSLSTRYNLCELCDRIDKILRPCL